MTGLPPTWVEARCQPGSLAGMARRNAAPNARANGREAVRPMAITDGRLRLGVFVQAAGHHVAGWRHPDAIPGGPDLALMRHIARYE